MIRRQLPRYVGRGGEQVFRHPYEATEGRFFGFVLPARQERLDQVLNRYLAEPSGGTVRFRSAVPYVLLNFVELRLHSSDPRDRSIGAVIEQEAAFWILADPGDGAHLAWFTPYMFVDSGPAIASGREVFGFPKQHGIVGLPERGSVVDHLSLQALGVRQAQPDVLATWHQMLTVTARDASATPATTPQWTSFGDAAREVARQATGGGRLHAEKRRTPTNRGPFSARSAAGQRQQRRLRSQRLHVRQTAPAGNGSDPTTEGELPDFVLDIAETLSAGRAPMIFLKQFRDAVDPDAAVHQSIVAATGELTSFGGGGLLGDYDVRIEDLDTQPVRWELGLEQGVLKPVVSFWLDLGFRLGSGTEVWSADERGAPVPRQPW